MGTERDERARASARVGPRRTTDAPWFNDGNLAVDTQPSGGAPAGTGASSDRPLRPVFFAKSALDDLVKIRQSPTSCSPAIWEAAPPQPPPPRGRCRRRSGSAAAAGSTAGKMCLPSFAAGPRRFNRNLAADTLLSGGGPAGTGASLPDRSPGRFSSAFWTTSRLVRDPLTSCSPATGTWPRLRRVRLCIRFSRRRWRRRSCRRSSRCGSRRSRRSSRRGRRSRRAAAAAAGAAAGATGGSAQQAQQQAQQAQQAQQQQVPREEGALVSASAGYPAPPRG